MNADDRGVVEDFDVTLEYFHIKMLQNKKEFEKNYCRFLKVQVKRWKISKKTSWEPLFLVSIQLTCSQVLED